MEERKETLRSLKVCRFCLTHEDGILQSLYDRSNKPIKNSATLPLKIMSCISVEVFPSDKMPCFICTKCKFFMDLFYAFKDICRRSDETILSYIQNGTALESTIWPMLFNKIYKNATKQPPENRSGAVKSVVESGAVLQLSRQDSDSDGDESVYNVKIEDGDDSSACINVIASKNNPDNKSKSKKESEEGDVVIADGCWACDECDCTYPLQQLLELHKMKKHRERVASCDQCDAKFFTKYDLESHKQCHSDEAPFQCSACDRRFKRLNLLRRHEKVMHSDMPRLKCELCPSTFFGREDFEAHQKRHRDISQRPHACETCDKRFTTKNALQRHEVAVHAPKLELSCEYCPERFPTVAKLAKHVRSHAGERSYPCKYCDQSFLKSHHYTRHIRLVHREESGIGAMETYRCEQCDDTFTTQDELIYHSAIHATQNLICPLCQEKFEDVDAVTTHIKSHVSGAEFQCEFCELVFTSKDKLKNHMLAMHEEDILNMQEDDLTNDSSMEVDDFDEENLINLKEEDDHMVVEIKKTNSFMLPSVTDIKEEEKSEPIVSEENDTDGMFTNLSNVKAIATPIVTHKNEVPMLEVQPLIVKTPEPVSLEPPNPTEPQEPLNDDQETTIVKKAEEVKRKIQSTETIPEKKLKASSKAENVSASDSTSVNVTPLSASSSVSVSTSGSSNSTSVSSSSTSGGTTDKSLRLLEKELQELKRTTVRSDTNKIHSKPSETPKRRQPPHASTPKLRSTDEKKVNLRSSAASAEKRVPERRAVKENKEPKETRTNTNSKEEKEKANNAKEEKETKEIDTPKNSVKNGPDKTTPEEGVRRSTRPSKIKDYAKMIRESTQVDDGDDDTDDDDEEYVEPEKSSETRSSRSRRATTAKIPANKTPVAKTTPSSTRKRGRPRKDQSADTSAKVLKETPSEEEENKEETSTTAEQEDSSKPAAEDAESHDTNDTQVTKRAERNVNNKNTTDVNADDKISSDDNSASEGNKTSSAESKPASNLLVSPTGQTLKKVPIKALPPGVKPFPLPSTARAMAPGETCEMQIGKKLVKVQKIVMTKAEVEAMAKKGLLEMKDGTMVLKPGIKLHTADSASAKIPVDAEGPPKESQNRNDKPTRCEIDEEAT